MSRERMEAWVKNDGLLGIVVSCTETNVLSLQICLGDQMEG